MGEGRTGAPYPDLNQLELVVLLCYEGHCLLGVQSLTYRPGSCLSTMLITKSPRENLFFSFKPYASKNVSKKSIFRCESHLPLYPFPLKLLQRCYSYHPNGVVCTMPASMVSLALESLPLRSNTMLITPVEWWSEGNHTGRVV